MSSTVFSKSRPKRAPDEVIEIMRDPKSALPYLANGTGVVHPLAAFVAVWARVEDRRSHVLQRGMTRRCREVVPAIYLMKN
jgi:hypothetical protein